MAITGISSIDNNQIIAAGALSAISANQALVTSGGDSLQGLYDTVSTNSGSWTGGGGSYVPYSALEVPLGTNNIATYTGFAQGANNLASYRSFAQGTDNRSIDWSFAQGSRCSASQYSIAQGANNSAYMFSQAFGLGTKIANTGMAIGEYNKTISGVSFVVGNGNSTGNRSDAFIIYPNGSVSAAGKISANGVELGAGGGSYPSNITADSILLSAEVIPGDSDYACVEILPTAINISHPEQGYGTVNTTNILNWNSTYETVSTNSASWTGGGGSVPDEVMSAASAVSANSATWNETTDTLSANSAYWGGNALPISAGAGISLSMVNGVLVISTAGV